MFWANLVICLAMSSEAQATVCSTDNPIVLYVAPDGTATCTSPTSCCQGTDCTNDVPAKPPYANGPRDHDLNFWKYVSSLLKKNDLLKYTLNLGIILLGVSVSMDRSLIGKASAAQVTC